MVTSEYLAQLGKIVYGVEQTAPPDNPSFYRETVRLHLEAAVYYRFSRTLPEPHRTLFRSRYRIQSAVALRLRTALDELYRGLDAAGVRYAPLKGADLAFRIYPEPALRHFNDFDILFHPDECEKVLDLLPGLGWKTPHPTRRRHLTHHHYDPYIKGIFHLEPHYTLPCFGDTPADDIWREIRPAGDHSMRWILSPELNLLMLARHASECDYRQCFLPKFLLDTAHLMKAETVDWVKLRGMADRWNLPRPENLLGAWPEFFPPEMQSVFQTDPRSAGAYRELLLNQSDIIDCDNAEWAMSAPERFSARWLETRLQMLYPHNIKVKHHLPANVGTARLIHAYWRECTEKVGGFFRHIFRPNRRIRGWMALIRSAERRHD